MLKHGMQSKNISPTRLTCYKLKIVSVLFAFKRNDAQFTFVTDVGNITLNSYNQVRWYHQGSVVSIGGLHCRHVGGQNKRKFAHKVCTEMVVNSQGRKIFFFLSTIMAAMTSHANHQLLP